MKTNFQIHLQEFKHHFIIFLLTFIYLFFICYYFADQLIFSFSKKLIQSNLLKYFIFTNITEIIQTNIFIALIISLFISLQLLFIQFWLFISNGLFKYENLNIIKFFCFFTIFNSLIINVILIKIIPYLWFFFINYTFSNEYLFNIYFEPKINNYFNFIFYTFIYIYLLFFYFFLLFYIILNQKFKIDIIINLRKIFYFKFLIIATIISPPDILSQFIITLFFIIFFELYIYLYLFIKKYFI